MKANKLIETEVFETSGVLEFSDGPVTINEREVHEFVRVNERIGTTPRLIVSDAIERTRDFIAKTRAEFGDLSSILKELAGPGMKVL